MKEQKTITLPESLDDITIRQLAQYMVANLDTERDAVESALRIFVGLSIEEQKRVAKKQLDELSVDLSKVLNEKPTLKTTFEYNNIEWGFVPNLEEISAGEYIDAESYMGDWSNMHKAMSVLYRPIVKKGKGWYEIEPYEGSDKYAGMLQDAPASVAVGALVFFWTIASELSNAILKHLQEVEMNAGLTPEAYLPSVGVGILPSSTWRAETFWYLMKLHDYPLLNS